MLQLCTEFRDVIKITLESGKSTGVCDGMPYKIFASKIFSNYTASNIKSLK